MWENLLAAICVYHETIFYSLDLLISRCFQNKMIRCNGYVLFMSVVFNTTEWEDWGALCAEYGKKIFLFG